MYTIEDHHSKKLFPLNSSLTESMRVGKILENTSTLLSESKNSSKKKTLIVEMEGIHVGRTANYIYYTEQGLKDGLASWTHPYNKPVLTHHNQHVGEPIGRILEAEFKESERSGRKGIFFKVAILDEEAQEKVLDGRYQTVSIGASTDKAICNICGTNRTEEWCEHWRGETYEGVQCHYATGTVSGVEVSYVNVPADKDAGNVSMSFSECKAVQVAENEMIHMSDPNKNLFTTLTESEQVEFNKKISSIFSTNEKEGRKNMELKEALDKITILENEVKEANAHNGKLVLDLKKVEEQVSEKEEAIKRLEEENKNLKKVELENLIEEVVNMKISLGKPDTKEKTKEELIEAHAMRTRESLEDLHGDLLLEKEAADASNSRKPVENPAAPTEGDKDSGIHTQEGEVVPEEEAINMIRGLFAKGGNK